MIKRKVLEAIATLGTADTANDLVTLVGTGPHDITHIIWRLQKQGLVTFQSRSTGRHEIPSKIRLTAKGIARLRR